MAEAKNKVKTGELYHHWKDPDTLYKVIDVGFTEWNEKLVVVYQNTKNNITWVRRLDGKDGWLTPVDRMGDDKNRFVLVE